MSTYAWLDGGSILIVATASGRRLGVTHMTLLDKAVGPWADLPDAPYVHVTYEYRRWAVFAGGHMVVKVIDEQQAGRLGALPARRTRGWIYPSARRSYTGQNPSVTRIVSSMRALWSTALCRSKVACRLLVGATALLYLIVLLVLLAMGTDVVGFALGTLVVTWAVGVFLFAGLWVIGSIGTKR